MDAEKDTEKLKHAFRGLLPPCGVEVELKTWLYIKQFTQQTLTKYPNTLQEDIEIVKKDEAENNLTFNEKNCVLIRKGEKEILEYLVSCADKAAELGKLTFSEAKEAMSKWEGHDKRCEPYFNRILLNLIDLEQKWN